MLRYGWQTDKFVLITGLDCNTTCQSLLHSFNGYSHSTQANKLQFYGKNTIEVEVKSYFMLFFQEILTPFYIFQVKWQ
jgi:hypothetical protein